MEEPEKIVSQTELDDKAQKLVEDKDADSRLRVYIGPMEKTLTAVLLLFVLLRLSDMKVQEPANFFLTTTANGILWR